MADLYEKGYDLISEILPYSSYKATLSRDRRKSLGAMQNPCDADAIEFSRNALLLPNGESFLRLDFSNDQGKRILVFGGESARALLERGDTFFLDGTFKSCPKQFSQLYSIHADLGSSDAEANVYPAIFAYMPDKREQSYKSLLRELKVWCPKWEPKTFKLDFECAAIKACMEEFPEAFVSGCNFHLNQCLWRKMRDIGLAAEYRNNEELKRICKMVSALALLPIDQIDEAWNIIWEKATDFPTLQPFLDYFVEQWLDNPNMPLKIWNVYEQRHRTNNAVEGWNSKLNRMTGRKQPNIHLAIGILEEAARNVTHVLASRELGQAGVKRRKKYVSLDERIKNIIREFEASKDLKKCLHSLSFIMKFE